MATKNTELTAQNVLQKTFSGISQNELRSEFIEAESNRSVWLVSAVIFGLKCLAVKEQKKHGEFSKFLLELLDEDKTRLSTARRYIHLSGKILEQIVSPRPETEIGAKTINFLKSYKKDGFKNIEDFRNFLACILGDYSLRSLNYALSEANNRALKDEDEDKKQGKIAKKAAQAQNPEEDRQLNFFEDLYKEVRAAVEVNRQDPRFLAMSKAELQELGDYLVLQGREIQNLAKNTR